MVTACVCLYLAGYAHRIIHTSFGDSLCQIWGSLDHNAKVVHDGESYNSLLQRSLGLRFLERDGADTIENAVLSWDP